MGLVVWVCAGICACVHNVCVSYLRTFELLNWCNASALRFLLRQTTSYRFFFITRLTVKTAFLYACPIVCCSVLHYLFYLYSASVTPAIYCSTPDFLRLLQTVLHVAKT
jgi:hypothetical protein